MTNPDRTPAEIADALEALAVENDEVDAIVSGGEHRAPLLRAAAARLRAMDEALKPMDRAIDELDAISRDLHDKPFSDWPDDAPACINCCAGDLRAARRARGGQ